MHIKLEYILIKVNATGNYKLILNNNKEHVLR